MKVIPIALLTVAPNRQRRAFDEGALQVLADSIESKGLMHPIPVRTTDFGFTLVAGERRTRAIKDLHAMGRRVRCDGIIVPPDYIPVVELNDLTPLEIEEAELEENTHRADLTWQERAAALARLAALRAAQAGARNEPPPTTADLALEVRGSAEGINHENTRKELIVARFLDQPEVAAAKSVDDAFKLLKKQETATRHRELGASVGKTFNASLHQAVNADSIDWMLAADAGQFDCILTDPPYGVGADEFGDSGGLAAGAHGYEDTPELALRCYKTLAVQGFRLTKPQAHAYVFCDIGMFNAISLLFTAAGWQVFRTPFIWYKRSGMRAPLPEHGPQRKYETLLYAIKGKRPVLRMAGDVLDYQPDTNLGHAAQKPVALYDDLLRRTCLPGNTVLDPFMGSGTIFAAAQPLKIKATGIELDTASYGIAVQRLEGLKAQQDLDLAVGL